MSLYNEMLYDENGHPYTRKNKFLYDLSQVSDPKQIQQIRKQKDQHAYCRAHDSFKAEEKKFLKELRSEVSEYRKGLSKSESLRMKGLKTSFFKSQKMKAFYEMYVDISYDAEFHYKEACIKNERLPQIISFLKENELELQEALSKRASADWSKESEFKQNYKKFMAEQQQLKAELIGQLKEKKNTGLISEKALQNGKKEIDRKYKEALEVKSFESEKKAIRELIQNKKHVIKNGVRQQLNVMNADISDLRRQTPVEVESYTGFNAYLTVLLPGLGQLLNKQYVKALLFGLISLFVYGIAIPYALGFGNYQGEGIAGLISLAEGGARIDKSLIFMIEGILAIFLLIISVIAVYVSFVDVKTVEKRIIQGVRPLSWFESHERIRTEGFPYLVSVPALLLTVFVVLVPITTTVVLSFTNMDPNHQSKFSWVGISNYKLIALGEGIAGSAFWLILAWTLIWTFVATTLAIVLGFALALMVNNERIKGKAFFRLVYILPWAVPSFITIMFFSIMLSPNGIMTELISGLFGQAIHVKTSPVGSRIVLILLQGWLGSAYVFLLSTGVLQAIPGDLYEAAQIDGATSWQKIRRITIPMVLFQTAPLLIGQYTFNFNNFSVIFLFNSGGPFNPTQYGNLAGTTDLLISYIFKLTMTNQYQAIAAAIITVISAGLMIFAFIGFRNSKAFKEDQL